MIINLDLTNPELSIYTELSENEVRTIYEPKPGLFIAESPNVIERALNAGYEPVSMLVCEKELKDATLAIADRLVNVPVYVAKEDEFAKITGVTFTRGALAAMRRKPVVDASVILNNSKRVAVLEDVVNPTNLGAIVRSAAALGMDAVLFSKGCTDPLYRRAIRVSMGTIFQIPWTFFDGNVSTLKDNGYVTVAMALKKDSVSIDDPKLKQADKLAIILGSEGPGLKDETIDSCDYTVMIPMSHGVDSLNVAAASAVAFYEMGQKK